MFKGYEILLCKIYEGLWWFFFFKYYVISWDFFLRKSKLKKRLGWIIKFLKRILF